MSELSLFTYKEAVNLISIFYTFTSGLLEDELEQIPEAKRFVEMGFTKRDEVHDDLYVLSETGEQVLHEYIKNISERFIKYMKGKRFESSCDEIAKWFKEEFELEADEDGEYIAWYICCNLDNYGYIALKEGIFYKLKRVKLNK